jgi:peptide deformylase
MTLPPLLPDSHPMLHSELPDHVFDGSEAELAATLIAAMDHYDGLGLAANQVGIPVRAFAMQYAGGSLVLFNPMVTWLTTESTIINEGCLSFEGLGLRISRPKECQVAYTNVSGRREVVDLKGMEARCALHEIDHLDGIVFTSLVSKLKLSMAKKKAKKHKNTLD